MRISLANAQLLIPDLEISSSKFTLNYSNKYCHMYIPRKTKIIKNQSSKINQEKKTINKTFLSNFCSPITAISFFSLPPFYSINLENKYRIK